MAENEHKIKSLIRKNAIRHLDSVLNFNGLMELIKFTFFLHAILILSILIFFINAGSFEGVFEISVVASLVYILIFFCGVTILRSSSLTAISMLFVGLGLYSMASSTGNYTLIYDGVGFFVTVIIVHIPYWSYGRRDMIKHGFVEEKT